MRKSNFKYNIGEKIGDVIIKENYTIVSSNKTRKKCKYHCEKCGNDGDREEYTLYISVRDGHNGCNACGLKEVSHKLQTPTIGVDDIETTAKWMIPYFIDDDYKKYKRGSDKKVFMKCPDCGRTKKTKVRIADLYKNRSIGCDCYDGMSYPEKFIYGCLEQLGYDFIKEYSPEWGRLDGIKRKVRFDFYIPLKNEIIEVDGGIGHGGKSIDKEWTPEVSLAWDKLKEETSLSNGIKTRRIIAIKSTLDDMKKSVIEANVFTQEEINRIDFEKVDLFCITNRAKVICETYEKLKPISTTELAPMFKTTGDTIRKFLKRGVKYGWCTGYDAEEEKKKGGESRAIKTALIKDGEILKIYNSGRKLLENSENDFGVKFSNSIMIECLKGKRENLYKGYSFKYIED